MPVATKIWKKPKNSRPDWYTDKCFLLEQHYESIADKLNWDRDRVRRLCRFMQITIPELAVMLRVRKKHMDKMVHDQQFPAHISLLIYYVACGSGFYPRS